MGPSSRADGAAMDGRRLTERDEQARDGGQGLRDQKPKRRHGKRDAGTSRSTGMTPGSSETSSPTRRVHSPMSEEERAEVRRQRQAAAAAAAEPGWFGK